MNRKLYNVCLCYHGLARSGIEKHTFRVHLEDLKVHIKHLKQLGYKFVKPSTFARWVREEENPSEPFACIFFDDALATIAPACEWLISQNIPFGIAIIARRLRKHVPEEDFLKWSYIKQWCDTGLCEPVNHSYNLHHLAYVQNYLEEVDVGPILEGPCWVDEGEFLYIEPDDTRWWWDYSFVDTISWGFPLFGSEPANNFQTPITSWIYFRATQNLTIKKLRIWAAIHVFPVPYKLYRIGIIRLERRVLGYDCQIRISFDGNVVCETTIGMKDYDTRAQWPEREWLTIDMDTPFTIQTGVDHVLEFKTLNVGEGCFRIFSVPCFDGIYKLKTTCDSAVPGMSGPEYRDFPANYDWPARACIILASGSGQVTSDEEYKQYCKDDLQKSQEAIEIWTGAQWFKKTTGYTYKEDPWLETIVIAGTYSNGQLADTKIKFVADETFTAHTFKIKYCGRIGDYYPVIVDVHVGTSPDGPWVKVARWRPNWYDWHWQEWELDVPYIFEAGQTYWIRFETKNASPYGVGLLTIYCDQQCIPHLGFEFEVEPWSPLRNCLKCLIWSEDKKKWVPGGCTGNEVLFWHDFDTADVRWYIEQPPEEGWRVVNEEGSDVWPKSIYGYKLWIVSWEGPLGGYCWTWGDDTEWWYEYETPYGGPGKPFLEFYGYNEGVGVSPPVTIAYPFGAYYTGGSGDYFVWHHAEDIHPALKEVLQELGIIGGFTIWATRPHTVSELVEFERRHTAYTIPRLMVYGDTGRKQALNSIEAYTGALFPDATHGGVKWQVSLEPDPFGNATVRRCYRIFDYVCFDAWFWRKNGVIEPGDINDGGIYLGLVEGSRSGEFQPGETVVEADTGATAEVVWATNNQYNEILKLTNLQGTWEGGKQITGQTSGATAIEDPEGPIQYADDKTYLQSRGVKCFLIINNYNPEIDDIDPDIFEYVVTHPDEYVDKVVQICLENGWDGIIATLEQQDSHVRDAATNFYRQLSRALHENGKLIGAALPAITGTDYDAEWWLGWCDLGKLVMYLDIAKIMSYTESGDWSDPAPHAPEWFWRAVYDYTKKVVHRRYWRRIFVGANTSCDVWTHGLLGSDYVGIHEAMVHCFFRGGTIKIEESEGHWIAGGKESWMGIPQTIMRAVNEAINSGFGGIGIWMADHGDIYESHPEWPQLGRREIMDFVEIRFPEDISRGSVGGPRYKTDIVQTTSGYEKRNIRWQEGLCRYDVSYGIRTQEQLDTLIAFFRARKGRAIGFRFKDWTDYRAVAQQIGIGDGTTTNFQLVKHYKSGDIIETRTIKKPVEGTVKIYLDGVEQTSGWSCDYTTGIISFDTPPASGVIITADFEFDVPVRFDTDELPITIEALQIGSIKSIPLVEIRV